MPFGSGNCGFSGKAGRSITKKEVARAIGSSARTESGRNEALRAAARTEAARAEARSGEPEAKAPAGTRRSLKRRDIERFEELLKEEEKSQATIGKYVRDVEAFREFAGRRELTKELVIEYKNRIVEQGYAPTSVNSMLASIRKLLSFLGMPECAVKLIRIQKQAYCAEERELTKAEYLKLLDASSGRPRLYLLLQTFCGTGIRVSELEYFTVEAVRSGRVTVSCKSKLRTVLIAGKLKKKLLRYAADNGVTSGMIFRTKSGKALDRSNIWSELKSLCARAGVAASKVFPHNLRKLFARAFYAIKHDIAKLADVLGHTNINTTRIYIVSTGSEHMRAIERLGIVV